MRPEFPRVIDSSLIAAFRSCPQKAYLEFMHHWKPRDLSVHLHAGKSYAAGLEAARMAFYVEGKDAETSVALGVGKLLEVYGTFECPPDSAKSAERTAGALEFYFDRYALGVDTAHPLELPGKKGIEFGFNEPIDLDDPEMTHPETGEPLLYCGRLDMMCEYNGLRLGEDDKTASKLGASWPRQWDLRSQFTSYIWGAKMGGIKLDGFLIRGVSILKTQYDTLEAITYRPEWQIERWHGQLKRDIRRMKECWAAGYFDYNLDHACIEYGGCPFRNVCQMKDPQRLLDQQFQRRRWDPVTRTETVLESE